MRIAVSLLWLFTSTLAHAGACPIFDFDLRSDVGPIVATGDSCAYANDNTASCGAGANSPDVTFLWTAPRTGTYQFDAAGSSFDTVLHIHDPQACNELVCNDDSIGLQSLVQLAVTAGNEYFIVFDGYNSGNCGTYNLNISVINLAPVFDPTLDFDNTYGFCPGDETFVLRGGSPRGRVALVTGTPGPDTPVPGGPCVGTLLPFRNPRLLAQVTANANGEATFSGTMQAAQCGTLRLVAINLDTCETSNIQTP